MSIMIWILIGLALFLVGFIVLQRRNPTEADKVSSALDSAFKKGVQDVKDAASKIGKK